MWIVLIIMNNVCDPWALKCQPSDPPIQDHPTPLFHSSRAIIGRWTLRWRSWQDFSTESFATCTKCTNRCILHTICMYVYNYIYMYVYSIYVHVHLYLHVHVHAHVHHLQVYIYIFVKSHEHWSYIRHRYLICIFNASQEQMPPQVTCSPREWHL